MPAKNQKNNNLAKSPVVANLKTSKTVILLLGAIAAFALIISVLILLNFKYAKVKIAQETIDDQIYNLSKTVKPSNFDLASSADKETGLPFIDQEKLGQEYIKDLKEIITALEQQIQPTSKESMIDVDVIKIIKKKAMSEIVPGQYQDLHIDLIFALDAIINKGDVSQAMNKLEVIKNNI